MRENNKVKSSERNAFVDDGGDNNNKNQVHVNDRMNKADIYIYTDYCSYRTRNHLDR